MRILYGVSGVGMGHAIRSEVVLQELCKKHEVFIVSSYYAFRLLDEHFPLVRQIEGFELSIHKHSVSSFFTLIKNLRKLRLSIFLQFRRIEEEISRFHPDVVLSDWEPYTSYYAKRKKLPFISIDNGHFLAFGQYSFPQGQRFQYYKALFFLHVLLARAQRYLILCLPRQELFNFPSVKKSFPLLRSSLLKAKPVDKNFIVVYLTCKKSYHLLHILKKIDEHFIVYGAEKTGREGNIVFRPFQNDASFLKDLIQCKAIIGNAGFTLISEAIYLGKPLFLIPLRKHFEQLVNAAYVVREGHGVSFHKPEYKDFHRFFSQLSTYKKKRPLHWSNQAFFSLLEKSLVEARR